MAIFTSGRTPSERYTIVPNEHLRTDELSWVAKGIGAYIASHAKGYPLTEQQIIDEGKGGKAQVRAALRELERAGLLRRAQSRDSSTGRFGPRDLIFDFAGFDPPP